MTKIRIHSIDLLNILAIDFSVNSSSNSSMSETSFMDTITTSSANINSVPSALPTPTSANYDDFHNESPSVKTKMYKKIKMDDMDK